MKLSAYFAGELALAKRQASEKTQETREALLAAQEELNRQKDTVGESDGALVELAALMDTALTCIQEQDEALVELAGLLPASDTQEGGDV